MSDAREIARLREELETLRADGDRDVGDALDRMARAIARPINKANYQTPRGADSQGSLALEVADYVEEFLRKLTAERNALVEIANAARAWQEITDRCDLAYKHKWTTVGSVALADAVAAYDEAEDRLRDALTKWEAT